jgi:hypothetical protein
MTSLEPTNRRLVASPAIPLIDGFGPLLGELSPLFVQTGDRLVTI